jgi:hypothetical protein
MRFIAGTFPLIMIKIACSQTPVDFNAKKIEFGFSTSTFAGASVNYLASGFLEKQDLYSYLPLEKPYLTFSNFGWKQGMFVWVNLNTRFSYKAQLDFSYSVNHFKKISGNNYCTSFGVEYKPQLIIRLGHYNTSPVIKMARDMSYYITGRQNYLIIGPKFTYARPDKSFYRRTNLKYASAGVIMGIGADNLFPNLEVAPELTVSAEYKTEKVSASPSFWDQCYISLSLAMNFF